MKGSEVSAPRPPDSHDRPKWAAHHKRKIWMLWNTLAHNSVGKNLVALDHRSSPKSSSKKALFFLLSSMYFSIWQRVAFCTTALLWNSPFLHNIGNKLPPIPLQHIYEKNPFKFPLSLATPQWKNKFFKKIIPFRLPSSFNMSNEGEKNINLHPPPPEQSK